MSGEPIVSICLAAFPGAHRALASLAATTRLSRHLSIAEARPGGPEIDFFCAHLRERGPKLLILGGWSEIYDPFVEIVSQAGGQVAIYWTSSGGQTDISREVGKLDRVLRHSAVGRILCASADLAHSLRGAVDAAHLPVTLDLRRAHIRGGREKACPTVSFFFPWREARRKNALNGLLAAASLGKRIRLHLNGLSEEPDYRALLETLRIPHRDLGWMEESVYRRALTRIDIGLQPSFAETFDYVAADHLARGIPVIGSMMVPAIAELPAAIRKYVVVPNPDAAGQIAERLERLAGDRDLRDRVGREGASALSRSNHHNIAAAAALLESLLAS